MRNLKMHGLKLVCGALATAALVSCAADRRDIETAQRREAFDLLTKGQELKAQGDLVLARDTFLKAAETSQRPVVYYEIANTQYLLGRPELALPYYEKALELAPDYELAQAELALVRLELRGAEIAGRTEVAVASATPEPEPEPAPEPLSEPAVPEVVIAASPKSAEDPDEPLMVAADSEETGETLPSASGREHLEMEEVEEEPVVVAQATPSPSPAPRATMAAAPAAAPSRPVPPASPDRAPEAPTSPASSSGSGVFGALTQIMGGAATDAEAGPVSLEPEEVRDTLFPELASPEQFDVAAERRLAAEAVAAGRFDEGARRWGRVVQRSPEDVSARLARAEALARTGRTQRAEEEYDRAAALAPDDVELLFSRANFHRRLGDLAAARADYERVVQGSPDHLRARNNLGALYLDMEPPLVTEAVATLQAVTEADPSFTSAWRNLALAQDMSGAPKATVLDTLERYARSTERLDEETEVWMAGLRGGQ